MTEKKHRWIGTTIVICLLASGPAMLWAQRPGGISPPGRQAADPLARLKRALEEAGAPPLSTVQETQIQALITELRDSRRGQRPDGFGGSRSAFDEAILAGDTARVSAQAASIAAEMSNAARARLESQANFAIQVLNILRSNGDQVKSLLNRLGTSGLVRLVSSLAGGPGRGPGGPGPIGIGQ